MEEYLLALQTNNKLLYLVNRKVAIVKCFNDLYFLMKIILGIVKHPIKFYVNNDFTFQEFPHPLVENYTGKNVCNQIINFIN